MQARTIAAYVGWALMKLGMAICLGLGMSCSPLAAQQTLLASGAPQPVFFSEFPGTEISEITSLPTEPLLPVVAESLVGLAPAATMYDAFLLVPEGAVCTQAVMRSAIAPLSDYAFDPQQFTPAALKAAFSHGNMVAMAHNFVPGQPLPDAPSYKPLTAQQKFESFLRNAHSVGMAVNIMSDALISQATGAYPRVNPGWAGFGERTAISAMGAESAAFIGGFVYPTLFHQDPRYFPSHEHGILNRMAYAVSRAVIGRSDYGYSVINTSVIASQFTEAAISNAYVPYRNESVSGTIENALTGIAGVAQGHILDEFWPDITEFVWRHTHSKLIREGMGIGNPSSQQVYH
jgi:hypothetical protein